MIRINLLPFRAARKSENIRHQASMFLLCMTFLFLVMAYLQISLSAKISDLEQEVDTAGVELKKYKQQAAEVDKIKAKLDGLKKRTDVVRELDKNRKAPVRFLEALTQIVIPNRMWLTTLKEDEGKVVVSGVALDNKTTADFMVRLESSQLFSTVNLGSVKHLIQNKQKMKQFQITCIKRVNNQAASGKNKK
jgi:type IV pilus assembly protein PilN